MSKWLKTEYIVKFSDCDFYSIVYNPKYLIWYEEARFEIARQIGIQEYFEEKKEKVQFPVINIDCKFIKPITIGSQIVVCTKIKRPKIGKIEFQHTIIDKNTGVKYASAETIVACVTESRGMILNFNEEILKLFDEYLES